MIRSAPCLALLFVCLLLARDAVSAPREFVIRKPLQQLVSLDQSSRIYHFASCASFNEAGRHVVPAVATIEEFAPHASCAAAGRTRLFRTVVIRQEPKVATRTNVLFIGNSLTYFNDLPWLVDQLSHAARDARPIRAEFTGSGGLTLEQQWERGEALARVYGESWDYVVLQEQSGRPLLEPALTTEFVSRFDEAIRESGARMVLFVPWTTRQYRSEQERVTRLFVSLAASHRALLAPVGAAWQRTEKARPLLRLYDAGGNHPTLAGSYLAACVIFSTLRQRTAAGLPHDIAKLQASDTTDSLTSPDALFLQDIAWRTVSSLRIH